MKFIVLEWVFQFVISCWPKTNIVSLYCGKWRKISKSRHDLDLDWTLPNS